MADSRLVVITGGPGAGKTTLVEALRARGHFCLGEAGRAILRSPKLKVGGEAVNANPERYARLMLERDWRQWRIGRQRGGTVFFDRGVPDMIGYLRLEGRAMPAKVEQELLKDVTYHREVFIAPPWLEIYGHDEERKQDWHEAVRTHDQIAEVYREFGYTLVKLPLAGAEERADFVLERLGLG